MATKTRFVLCVSFTVGLIGTLPLISIYPCAAKQPDQLLRVDVGISLQGVSSALVNNLSWIHFDISKSPEFSFFLI